MSELPRGTAFVFSVARFDDPEHFGIYETLADVQSRYAGLLRILAARETDNGQKLVVAGRRLGEARPSREAKPAELSVIVPCRNAGPDFRSLLESLVSQVVTERAEIIVVDNGSTDGSRSVAEACPDRSR